VVAVTVKGIHEALGMNLSDYKPAEPSPEIPEEKDRLVLHRKEQNVVPSRRFKQQTKYDSAMSIPDQEDIDGLADELILEDSTDDAVIDIANMMASIEFEDDEDSAGFDKPLIRTVIEQKLIESLGSFSTEVRNAFADPKNKTVRAALGALMIQGLLTPKRWFLIKRGANYFVG
jgi:hypothetical protein